MPKGTKGESKDPEDLSFSMQIQGISTTNRWLCNACNYLIMANRLALLELVQAFLHFLPKPLIMIQIGLHDLKYKLFRIPALGRRKTVDRGLNFRRKVNFHGDSLNQCGSQIAKSAAQVKSV